MTEDKLSQAAEIKKKLDTAIDVLQESKSGFATFRISKDVLAEYHQVSTDDIRSVIGDEQYHSIRKVLSVLLIDAIEKSVSILKRQFNDI